MVDGWMDGRMSGQEEGRRLRMFGSGRKELGLSLRGSFQEHSKLPYRPEVVVYAGRAGAGAGVC